MSMVIQRMQSKGNCYIYFEMYIWVGMTGVPIYNTLITIVLLVHLLLHLAKQLVEGGIYDCVLALGFEKRWKDLFKWNTLIELCALDKTISLKSMELMPTEETLHFAPRLFGNTGLEHMKRFGTKP